MALLRSASCICVPASWASESPQQCAFQVLCVWKCEYSTHLYIFTHPYIRFYKEACAYVCAYAVFFGSILELERTSGDHKNSNLLPSHSVFSA